MATQIIVPSLGESISEATVLKWLKQVGEAVDPDEPLVELETDKVTVEVPAPAGGRLESIAAGEGSDVQVGAVLGAIGEGAAAPSPAKGNGAGNGKDNGAAAIETPEAASAPAAPPPAQAANGGAPLSPAVRKLVDEHGLDPAQIPASGKGGRLTKGDVLAHLASDEAKPAPPVPEPVAARTPMTELPPRQPDPRGEEAVRMTKLRQTVARRLKEAQQTAAMLTTFNEVDMGAVMELSAEYRDKFEKKHGVRLGFMSFFIKASVVALKEIPTVNAEIRGDDIIYKNYYDIGVAVGGSQGLVVPVLRDADKLSFAELERMIADFGRRAREGGLAIQDLTGGTFTISNGGVFGSLLSTPILNLPQSAILGMHKIQKRPMVVEDEIAVRPMMYLALSYDHRIIDGREAVTFLVRIKENIEDPQRLLIDACQRGTQHAEKPRQWRRHPLRGRGRRPTNGADPRQPLRP